MSNRIPKYKISENLTYEKISIAGPVLTVESMALSDPQLPILSWVDCKLKKTKEEVVRSLVDAFTNPVDFRGCIQYSIDYGIQQYVELSDRGSMLQFVKNVKKYYP